MICLKVVRSSMVPAYAGMVALSFALIVCVRPVSAITWGEPDGNRHPNVGAVIINSDLFDPFIFCSGTLIDEEVFLTSGRCTYFLKRFLVDKSGVEVFVSFSSDKALDEEAGEWLLVTDAITHSKYNGRSTSNPRDVGVLILEEAATGITPAVLPVAGFLDDLRAEGKLRTGRGRAKFTVVGYGATLEWPPPRVGRLDGVRRVSTSEYLNLRKARLHMSQNHAPGRGNGGTCYGDFGGPVFWVEDGTEILVAVTFWGDAQRVATGTSYRVDIPDTLDFIAAYMGTSATASPAPGRPGNRLAATWWGRAKSD